MLRHCEVCLSHRYPCILFMSTIFHIICQCVFPLGLDLVRYIGDFRRITTKNGKVTCCFGLLWWVKYTQTVYTRSCNPQNYRGVQPLDTSVIFEKKSRISYCLMILTFLAWYNFNQISSVNRTVLINGRINSRVIPTCVRCLSIYRILLVLCRIYMYLGTWSKNYCTNR
jgi:hypothetical protein